MTDYPHISELVKNEQLERQLLDMMDAASARHAERHVQMMDLLAGVAPKDVDWEAWDRLSALQDADWQIVDGAQRQLRAIGYVPAS